MNRPDLKGVAPESWACIDCGFDTAPGAPNRAQVQKASATAPRSITSGKRSGRRRVWDRRAVACASAVWKSGLDGS